MQLQEDIVLEKMGDTIRKLREKKGWSLRQMADRCGIDNSKIAKIEKGTINITVLTLMELAIALGVTPGELLGKARRR